MNIYRIAQNSADYSKLEKLRTILSTMDIPQGRMADHRWILRNLAVRNREHPNFSEAIGLLKELGSMLAPPLKQEDADKWHKHWDKAQPQAQSTPVYCSYCKTHMKGPDVGYNHQSVSHSACPTCLKEQVDKRKLNELVQNI